MVVLNNSNLIREIETGLLEKLPVKLGVNKRNELKRLAYEICIAQERTLNDLLDGLDIEGLLEQGRGELFHRVKSRLLSIRYPSISPDDDPHIMPLKDGYQSSECDLWGHKLDPETIFIENAVSGLDWTNRFLEKFPDAKLARIDSLKQGLETIPRDDPVQLYNSRRENVFLVKNEYDFIKICPCTQKAKRCGYWILNVGFGCPADCSYCYLQMYSNVPGMVFPANIEDYYPYIEEFNKKAATKTRIGTGEFTDSLAYDKYTDYSGYLIPFFRDKRNLVLEFKTKVADIDNVLVEDPHESVVISWSVNTREMARRYEKGAATVSERIQAALKAAKRGYKVGFHFDPIVYYEGWEEDYGQIVEELFSHDEIRKNTAWISLGTLRYTPGLKQSAEQRFEDNIVFYQGEFFAGFDGKLRYPEALRLQMYKKMAEWIKASGTKAWVYLCMEEAEMWKKAGLG